MSVSSVSSGNISGINSSDSALDSSSNGDIRREAVGIEPS